jgi:hypothetical protein
MHQTLISILGNGTVRLAKFLLEPIEATSEEVNNIKILKKK